LVRRQNFNSESLLERAAQSNLEAHGPDEPLVIDTVAIGMLEAYIPQLSR
jgi:hypothetical protein